MMLLFVHVLQHSGLIVHLMFGVVVASYFVRCILL